MVIQFEKCELKLDDIHKEEISSEKFAPHERTVIYHIKNWIGKVKFFQFNTSGSTGKPKTISIPRKKIEYSSSSTLERLDPDNNFTSSLLCINPEMIGGAMVVFRALIGNMNLKVIPPTANPFEALHKNDAYDLVSMVPVQMWQASVNQLNQFNVILVGGAYLGNVESPPATRVYATFGMTETVSHFALRDINEDYFECIGDVRLSKAPDNKLRIKGTITDNKLLETNDLIAFISDRKFKWTGRSDFVINSGGIKIIPELVESKLKIHSKNKFIISSLPDDRLDSRVVLLIEGQPDSYPVDFSNLEKYEKPKEVYFMPEFPLTASGKVDRIMTKNKLLQQTRYTERILR